MRRRVNFFLPFMILISLACGLFAPVSPPTPTVAPVILTSVAETESLILTETALALLFTPTPNIPATQTESAAQTATLAASYTSTPIPSATPEINPNDLVEEEKPTPPPAVSPGGSYQLADELLIGAYGIRYWHNSESPMGFDDIVLIEKTGVQSIRIETASALEPLSGADINGDDYPEVIIETYTGGAHCCFGTQVYSLGEKLTLLLKKPESNAGGQFKDLDGDDIYEFVTYDDLFAYQYCAYAGSPFVKVIMAYDADAQSYLPASPNFPDEYIVDIQNNTEIAESVKPGDYAEWDETTKCGALPLLLDYIYLGDLEKAHEELLRIYPYGDAEDFWDEILLQVQDSPLYIAKETKDE